MGSREFVYLIACNELIALICLFYTLWRSGLNMGDINNQLSALQRFPCSLLAKEVGS